MRTKKSTLFHLECIMHAILSVSGKCKEHTILWNIKDNISFSNDTKAFTYYTYDINTIVLNLLPAEKEKYQSNLKQMKNYY